MNDILCRIFFTAFMSLFFLSKKQKEPCIFYGGRLYMESSELPLYNRVSKIGTIESAVAEKAFPKSPLETNRKNLIGSDVYMDRDGKLIVWNGSLNVFKKL